LAEHRTTVIGWLRDDPSLELDAAAERLADTARVHAPTRHDAINRARDYIKQLYRSMYDQGLIAANDWLSLRAAAKTEPELERGGPAPPSGIALPRDLRPKNAYNLIRLLDLAIRWLSAEPPTVRVSDSLRPTLIAIEKGEVPMPDVMALARELTPKLEAARQTSPLPRYPDVARADRVLRAARAEAARRCVQCTDDAWGAHSAAPPEARFDE
ncbi:MAG TPA: hypothetical protein VMZ53_25515, partial [Kofleriaceae bacterium]|nr:hypothetical protein [Kofleriaceae bacterium]